MKQKRNEVFLLIRHDIFAKFELKKKSLSLVLTTY